MALWTRWRTMLLPVKRSSSAALWESTATRSSMTFRAMLLGTCCIAASGSRARVRRGTSSPADSCTSSTETRSTFITSNMVSATVARSLSRSNSPARRWEISSSSESLRAVRSWSSRAVTLSWLAVARRSTRMAPGATGTWLTMVLRGVALPSPPEGVAAEAEPAAETSSSWKTTLPKVIESRGSMRPIATRAPLMAVPLELPRSRTWTPSGMAVSSAWRRLMVGS